jgi:hypothetical protein
MKQYKCHKEVSAFKITSMERVNSYPDFILHGEVGDQPVDEVVSKEYIDKHDPQLGGYYVMYADGYESYSPAEAFEEGYTEIQSPMWSDTPIIKYFKYGHLSGPLKAISQQLCELALSMDSKLDNGPEKSAGLRKLLEAKDCFVRAAIK